jgi:hypothetical protein
MINFLSVLVDKISIYLAPRKGLLPLLGIGLIIINLILQFFPVGWLRESNLFFHLGVIIALLGFMLSWML